MAVKTKDRWEWMTKAPNDMSPERNLIENLITWFEEAGWHDQPDSANNHIARGYDDAVIDTGHGLILVSAKERGPGDLGRIEIQTFPRMNRIYLFEQPDGTWRIKTESNTIDARPVDANGLKSVLEEMLAIA